MQMFMKNILELYERAESLKNTFKLSKLAW